MEDSTLAEVGKNLSEAMRILGDGQRELKARSNRTSIPGPLQGDGQDVASILHLVHHLIHENEEDQDKSSQQMQNVGEQGHMALLGHSLAAYISVLDKERLWRLTTRILSDTTLWLCRLFRYESGSAYFHEDDRDGIVRVCRLVISLRYEDYASEGYTVLNSKPPVIYQSSSCRPNLGQHLCSQLGLPLSSLCTVPCNTVFGSQHQLDVALLDKLIREDLEAGKLPLLLVANAGTPGAGHTDKLGRLKELCDQYNMWFHVEGVNLATLALDQVPSAIMAATRGDSLTLTPGQWLGLPAVSAVTLYRHEDPALSLAAGLTSSRPAEKLRALPLWLSLQYLGHNGIVEKIRHATSLSQQLLQKLESLTCINTLVEDELSSPVVLFKFSPIISAGTFFRDVLSVVAAAAQRAQMPQCSGSSGDTADGYCAGEKQLLDAFNKWLWEQLAHLVPTSGVDVVELEDEGTCVRFNPLLTAAGLGTMQEDVDSLAEKLADLVSVMSSTWCLRPDFKEETRRRSSWLRYVEDLSWPGLGAVRYEPQTEGIEDSRRHQALDEINAELLKKLQELDTDIIFSTGSDYGTEENCILIHMVTEDVDVSELAATIAALGLDIEENGRLLDNMTEVVRKGILEAEQQLQKANEEKLIEEGLLRQLPLVGSVLNWFSPVEGSIKGRTFNLAAGSLDSTEVTYSTKTQAGRTPQQDSATPSSRKLPGQRLFRRSGASADSFSETSSVGHLEDSYREESTAASSSALSSTWPPAPQEDSHRKSRTVPETAEESSPEQEHAAAKEASEERQPES